MTGAGPLHGPLVADFSRVLAGSLATMRPVDLGATVVKVERPGTGDGSRSWDRVSASTPSSFGPACERVAGVASRVR